MSLLKIARQSFRKHLKINLMTLTFLLLGLYTLFFHSHSPFSSGNSPPLGNANAQGTPNVPLHIPAAHSNLNYHGWYEVKIRNRTIGLAVVGIDDIKNPFHMKYILQMASQFGDEPVVQTLSGNFSQKNSDSFTLVQKLKLKSRDGYSQENTNQWQQEKSHFQMLRHEGARLSDIIGREKETTASQFFLPQKTGLFFFNGQPQKTERIFLPINGSFQNQEQLTCHYDPDGFLGFCSLPLESGFEVSFRRISEKKYLNTLTFSSAQLMNLSFLQNLQKPEQEFESLKKNLYKCSVQTKNMENNLLRSVPQMSYLGLRRVVNIRNFCQRASWVFQNSKLTPEEKYALLGRKIRQLLNENELENPISIAQYSQKPLFFDESLFPLWPKMANNMITNALEELQNQLTLAKNRKSLVALVIQIQKLFNKAVVRAKIHQISSPISIAVLTKKQEQMSHSSLKSLQTEKLAESEVVNGLFFLNGKNEPWEQLCEKKHKIVLDLGETHPALFHTATGEKLWNFDTKKIALEKFLFQTTQSASCNQIEIRVPQKNFKQFQLLVQEFRKTQLSLNNDLLVHNRHQQKIWMIPGKYQMFLSSVITGKTIAAHEFTVGPKTMTRVIAKSP